MTHPLHDLDDVQLERLAGTGALARGIQYAMEDRVTHLRATANGLDAEVSGTTRYRLWLRDEGDRLAWFCDCPAAEDGDFCKHLVAAVLTFQDETEPTTAPDDETLLAALRDCAPAQLAEWLAEAARRDPDLHQCLRLRLALDTPKALEARLEDLLEPDEVLDYTGSLHYADQLEAVVDLLDEYSLDHPDEGVRLCEQALERGLAHYRNADGAIGEWLHTLAATHADACQEADNLGEDFADRLHRLKRQDEWDLFPLMEYWALLDDAGQRRYAQRVLDAFEAGTRRGDTEADAFYTRHLRVELAEQQNDVTTLIDVYREELPAFLAYRNLIRLCQQNGRLDDALAWAEQAAEAHPNDPEFHQGLARLYHDTGRTGEALEILWRGFQRRLDLETWDNLLDLAGPERDAWYQRARDTLMAREAEMDHYHRSRLIDFFIHNDDAAGALPLARERTLPIDTLLRLADAVRADHPADAAALLKRVLEYQLRDAVSKRYPFAVRLMKRLRRYAPTPDTDAWLADLRQRFARRPALIRRMDQAGL